VDLADASLEITSQQGYTTSSKAVKEFYETWSKAVGQDMTKKLTDLIPLTERAVQLRTLAWLSHWVAEGRENATLVPEKSIKNWDNMARHYFDPDNLEAMLSAKNPDAKTARRPIKNQPPKPR
jgi:thymidylate synthase